MNDSPTPDPILSQNVEDQLRWSDLQLAIYDAIQKSAQPLLIQGVAGCAKTTTIVHGSRFAQGPVLFLAFNRSIAEETRSKLQQGDSLTLNALGNRLCLSNKPAPQTRLDAKKNERLIEALVPDHLRRAFGYTIGRIIEAAKNSGLGLEQEVNASDFERFISAGDWDIDDSDVPAVAHWTSKVFNAGLFDPMYDFTDQLYWPIYRDWDFPAFGTVLIDEAQDLNRIQHLMLGKLRDAGALVVAVGDRNQSIYGFRGALFNSLDLLKEHFGMTELPLSITYRCPLSVVREAQALVPHIQARPGAPEGAVYWREAHCQSTGQEPAADPALFTRDNELIVCRNNAPLMAAVMRQVRARQPCRVLSNALEGLASFVRRFRTQDAFLLLAKVDRWLEKETSAAQSKGMDWKVAALQDKADTVRSLAEGFKTTEEVLSVIRQLSEGRSGPLFSTIHKAKGLEADHVFFLRPDLVPGWWIKEPEALQQEANLRYVAITRARDTLTYGTKGDRR
jgi:superfamily I DNA/RNA helicase